MLVCVTDVHTHRLHQPFDMRAHGLHQPSYQSGLEFGGFVVTRRGGIAIYAVRGVSALWMRSASRMEEQEQRSKCESFYLVYIREGKR